MVTVQERNRTLREQRIAGTPGLGEPESTRPQKQPEKSGALGLAEFDPNRPTTTGGAPNKPTNTVIEGVPQTEKSLLERKEVATLESEGAVKRRTPQETAELEAGLESTFEEQGVFKDVTQVPISTPEQENLGVVKRIAESLIPDSIQKINDFFTLKAPGDVIPEAEIRTIEAEIKEGVRAETSIEIDDRIEETEDLLVQNGIPLLSVVGGAIIGSAVSGPVGEFVGTDGQIASLELALSQYNEMITIPARSLDAGLTPSEAFDKYNRMEDSILALDSELRTAALTSPKVALALRGRGVDARLIKLKEKLQEGRRDVAFRMAQESFGEIELTDSLLFLRRLRDERKAKA